MNDENYHLRLHLTSSVACVSSRLSIMLQQLSIKLFERNHVSHNPQAFMKFELVGRNATVAEC